MKDLEDEVKINEEAIKNLRIELGSRKCNENLN